jgi:branched-chain amino acid transport system substrate-binding protein
MKNKTWAWIVAIIIIVAIVWGAAAHRSSKTIKIGIVAPLTGGANVYGTGLVNGARMAINDLPANIRGSYELVVEDDGTKPAQSATAAQKLISIDHVQALISVTSGTGNAVKAVASAAKVPHICVCADTRIGDATDFTNSVMPDEETLAWLREAAARGVKTAAIITQNQPAFNLMNADLVKAATSTGITIVSNQTIEPTVQDFNTIIAKAKTTKPDIYLIGFFPPQLDIIGTQLQNQSVKNTSGIATFTTGAKPELWNDKWYTDASLVDTAFKSRFEAAYPGQRFNVRVVPQGYDSVNLLVAAFRSGKDVSEYIRDLASYDGKAGKLTKAAGESVFHSPIGIWEMKDGAGTQLK